MKKKLRPLSVMYVIIIPSLFFAFALLIMTVGIPKYPQGFVVGESEIGYATLGTPFIVLGVIILLYVLLKIEGIAKRTEDLAEQDEGSV